YQRAAADVAVSVRTDNGIGDVTSPSPHAGRVGYWPRGLASWIDISRVRTPVSGQHRGSACGSASRQSDTLDSFHWSKVGPRPTTRGLATALIVDIRSLFRS